PAGEGSAGAVHGADAGALRRQGRGPCPGASGRPLAEPPGGGPYPGGAAPVATAEDSDTATSARRGGGRPGGPVAWPEGLCCGHHRFTFQLSTGGWFPGARHSALRTPFRVALAPTGAGRRPARFQLAVAPGSAA